MDSSSNTTTNSEQLFDAAFLDRLRALFLKLRKRRQLRKKGIQSTPATGFTREFKDFRHYTPDDDYRSIDWRVYARLGRLFIRLYEEIQEFHLHVVVDTSASMARPFPEKRITALKIGVALSYLGLIGQHRVSFYSMGTRIREDLPPLKGQGNIQRILDYASRLEFGGATTLRRAFREFRPSRRRYGIIFVISDFYGGAVGAAQKAVKSAVSWPGETHFIHVHHPWEENPELDGEIELLDVETNEMRRLWFTKKDLEKYVENYREFQESLERACISGQMDYQRWRTDQPFEDLFLEMLSRGSALAHTS